MHKRNFIYLGWNTADSSKSVIYKGDHCDTVEVTTSVGPYKNVFSNFILDKNECYYWEVRIIKGTLFKIGIFKMSELPNFKGKAFSDSPHGFAYYSSGQLRNNTNKATSDFAQAYGPGDIIGVQLNTKTGELFFNKNGQAMKLAYKNDLFKAGGYVPVVAALLEGSRFSLTLPTRQD